MNTETKINIDEDAKNIVLPPKKKRVVKRFTSKEQIIDKIDKFTKKAKHQRAKQQECYADAKKLRDIIGRSSEMEQVTLQRSARRKDEEGDRWGRKADRLEKDVLKALSQKLAEFQTETIPGVLTDRSIPGL